MHFGDHNYGWVLFDGMLGISQSTKLPKGVITSRSLSDHYQHDTLYIPTNTSHVSDMASFSAVKLCGYQTGALRHVISDLDSPEKVASLNTRLAKLFQGVPGIRSKKEVALFIKYFKEEAYRLLSETYGYLNLGWEEGKQTDAGWFLVIGLQHARLDPVFSAPSLSRVYFERTGDCLDNFKIAAKLKTESTAMVGRRVAYHTLPDTSDVLKVMLEGCASFKDFHEQSLKMNLFTSMSVYNLQELSDQLKEIADNSFTLMDKTIHPMLDKVAKLAFTKVLEKRPVKVAKEVKQ